MNKQDLIQKLKQLDGLTADERAALINLVNTKKKYGLVWEDKPEDVEEQLREKLPVLKEMRDKAIINGNDYPNHILIEGDNLHALTALTFTHEGKIDVIYFDPPYNTGAKDWKYNNDFVDEKDGWRHSKWINFMFRRLNIAKSLMTENGALVCAIDHNEQENVGILLREIFPNKEITCVTIIHNPRGIQGDNFSYTHEFAYFVYPKGKFIGRISRDQEEFEWSNLRNWGGESERKDGKSLFYPIYFKDEKLIGVGKMPAENFHPTKAHRTLEDGTLEIWPIDNNGIERKWRYATDSLMAIQEKIRLVRIDGILQAQILKDEDRPKTVWIDKKYDANSYGTQLLNSIIKTKFPFPKSLYTVEDCITAVLNGKKDAIILDYFAGSGTTGHAVLNINKLDNGNRKFILCTNNESNICEQVTYERIKNCIQGYDFTGFEKDILLRKKLSISILKKSEKLFEEINKISLIRTGEYNSLKVEIEDNYIQLIGFKKITSFKHGFKNNNFRYYKCEFISSTKNEVNKRQLTQSSTELLQIKEECYNDITEINGFNPIQCGVFTDKMGKYMIVVYHSRNQNAVCEQLVDYINTLAVEKRIKLYAFSPEKETLAADFADVAHKIDALPLPDAIYNAYRATFRILGLDKKLITPPETIDTDTTPILFDTTTEA